MAKRKPIKEFRIGRIQVAIWKNESEENGKTIVKHSIYTEKTSPLQAGHIMQIKRYVIIISDFIKFRANE